MAASIANFRCFDAEVEEWELFREQLEQFYVANKIEENIKKAMLINHLCSKTYKLLRDLCTPDQPKDRSYAELCKLLSTHFTPPVVVHKERRCFFRAKRHENGHEAVNEWIVRIKNLATNCKFGDTLQHNLVNKFIDGLEGKPFERICEEGGDLTLEKAQELALRYEVDTTEAPLNFVKRNNLNQSGANRYKSNADAEKRNDRSNIKCFACAKMGHYKKDCRFKDYVCRKCNQKGHVQSACDSRRNYYVAATTAESKEKPVDKEEEDQVQLQQNYIHALY
ncbi:uncharacterized protein LOC131428612 [Malaya genurostris]|uniref:uncharacterized protein LOC131428612 n=1 Tax=Malaya genurostris TaxID=325434 RepID=UPI0026F3EA57|nr:uncharacterized protein LOC131428612 [Malaya genurostris]